MNRTGTRARSTDQTETYKMGTPYIESGSRNGSRDVTSDLKLNLLLDKLGARQVFESQGVRLYQTLLQKHAAIGAEFPIYYDLERYAYQEQSHFVLLQNAIFELGGDPIEITPAADVTSVISTGVLKVITDPRTTIAQCLEGLLTAELVDNDSWEMLIGMLREQNRNTLIQPFEQALNEEREHLSNVRSWLQQETRREAAA